MSAIAIPSSGTVRTTLTQKRRLISRNSGFSSSTAVTVRGSRAIPQIGQLPGSCLTISGCIGQVYSTLEDGTGVSGSSAIPQLGQGPCLVSRTSGHMGHTKATSPVRFCGGLCGEAVCGCVGAEVFKCDSGLALNFSRHPALQKKY